MSEYSEANTTNELLDYLGQDCEWAAECVRARYNLLKRERVEVEAELSALKHDIARHLAITADQATELSALKDAARAVVDNFRGTTLGLVLWTAEIDALAALLDK